MVLRRILVIFTFVLCSLVFITTQISCVNLSGPGIMPPVNDNDHGEWEVLKKDLFEVEDNSGRTMWQWQVVVRYVPEIDGAGLEPLDISATMDSVPVPFTFDPHSQVFESTPEAQPTPGSHKFQISPSRERSKPFPTLTLVLEKP